MLPSLSIKRAIFLRQKFGISLGLFHHIERLSKKKNSKNGKREKKKPNKHKREIKSLRKQNKKKKNRIKRVSIRTEPEKNNKGAKNFLVVKFVL